MPITETYRSHILRLTGARAILHEDRIQSLWSGYGVILRLELEGGSWPSVIAKVVSPPGGQQHPRGWNTDIGHQRKLKSYQVETAWYSRYARVSEHWRTARFIGATAEADGQLMVMEDLNAAGYPLRRQRVSMDEIQACLSWLAHFHAAHLGLQAPDLWEEGTYWHLDTRPEELAVMRDGPLKRQAAAIDAALKACRYRSLVHGDAKLANFCFAADGRVAAVDFQYVGGGCGMKDVAYFLGSCLDEDACARHEQVLLDHYFQVLRRATDLEAGQAAELEQEWRGMYAMAWADFTRFLEGWMPSHQKLHRYSRAMVEQALQQLQRSTR